MCEAILNILRNNLYTPFTSNKLTDIFRNKSVKIYYSKALEILMECYARNCEGMRYRELVELNSFG